MDFKKITKVSIFIDYDNFQISYCEKHNIKEEQITIWDSLSEKLIDYYQAHFVKNDFEVIEHSGTYLCVGISDNLIKQEQRIKKRFQALDRKIGYIVKYGNRSPAYKDNTGNWRLGKEKGVDSEIICQMLMGAFLNHYDSCILLSDDYDYVPVVTRIQDFFGKKVIQAGFFDGKLRNQVYGHIPLEHADVNLNIINGS